jgi:phosphohistidine swiveling domain-containing protein
LRKVKIAKHAEQTDTVFILESDAIDQTQNVRALVGGKAASLLELQRWGLPVPTFCCITTQALEETLHRNNLSALVEWLQHPAATLPLSSELLEQAIMTLVLPAPLMQGVQLFLQSIPDAHVAVRSSGTLEDAADTSFAGLYRTVLNLKSFDDVCDAIKTCWLGLFDERVLTYLAERSSHRQMGLALVVQRLVPAEKSGVLFTVDPVRGCDTEMLVEACFGLGEALVSGHVTPDAYRYDWYRQLETDRIIAEKEVQCVRLDQAPFTALEPLSAEQSTLPVLSRQELAELVHLGVNIQEQAGFPVDIEWARVGKKFYILQSRPITQLGFAGIAGEWTTADFRDGGVSATVCTPYMASLYKSIMDFSMSDHLRRLGLPIRAEKEVWLKSFYSRPYWNLEAVKYYLSHIPDFNERAFDEGLGIAPNYQGDGIVSGLSPKTLFYGIRALLTIQRSCKRKLKECPDFSRQQKARLRELKALDLNAMADDALFAFAAQFLTREYFNSEATYFDFIYDNTNLNGLFKDSIKNLAFSSEYFPLLLVGLSGVSHLAPIEAQWALCSRIRQSADSRQYWQTNSAAAIAADWLAGETRYQLGAVSDFMDRFGHHAKQELDLTVPRYVEAPEYVIAQIQDVLQQPLHSDPVERNRKQEQVALDARQKLLAAASFWKRRSLGRKLDQVRAFLWWREELRDLSTQFYLYVRKITLAVEQRLLQQKCLQHNGDIFFLALDDLLAVLRGELGALDVARIVARNRQYYNSFAGFTIPDEIGERYSNGVSGSSLDAAEGREGVPGSPGVVTGIARVIANINDAHRLQPGDILVTRCTDPGWTPKFSLLSGVITETGGILSHAAVICREYGMPAILAVKKATTLIRDGETISIDGGTGVIMVTDGAQPISLGTRRAQLQPAPAAAVSTAVAEAPAC